MTFLAYKSENKLNKNIPIDLLNPEPFPSKIVSKFKNSFDLDALKSESLITYTIQSGDNMGKIFKTFGLSPQHLHQLMQAHPLAAKFKDIKPGQKIQYHIENNKIKRLDYLIHQGKSISVLLTKDGYNFKETFKFVSQQIKYIQGEINESLFSSARKLGIENKIVNQIVDILGWDIDFALDLRKKDKFRILYEENFIDEQKIDSGPILALEFINQGKKHSAIRFTDKTGYVGYYSPKGEGLHKPFIRTPVKFTHISSYFGHRKHPILHRFRIHKGVDYAAPIGTPVKATGHAKVIFCGIKQGYGKVIELQHAQKYTTLYAHLSKFANGIRKGSLVDQGQVIGFVGKTGLASGPHLHYEFRINGVHHNPLTVNLPRFNIIQLAHKQTFDTHAKKLLSMLDQFENIKLAQSENLD